MTQTVLPITVIRRVLYDIYFHHLKGRRRIYNKAVKVKYWEKDPEIPIYGNQLSNKLKFKNIPSSQSECYGGHS